MMNLHWLLARFAAIIAFALASLPCVVSAELPPAPQQIGTSTFKFSGTWVMSAEGDADDYWLYFTRPEDRSEAFHRDEDDLYAFEIVEEGEWTLNHITGNTMKSATDAITEAGSWIRGGADLCPEFRAQELAGPVLYVRTHRSSALSERRHAFRRPKKSAACVTIG
jgi:hypothetical protein